MRKRAAFLVAVSTLILMVTWGGAAQAHTVYSSGDVYSSSYDCTWVKAQVTDGNYGTGNMATYLQSEKNSSSSYCATSFYRPGGNIAIKEDLYHWNGYSWDLCNSGPWNYSQSTAWTMSTGWWFNKACGPGYYYNEGYGYEYNGGWHGGGVYSGYHYYA